MTMATDDKNEKNTPRNPDEETRRRLQRRKNIALGLAIAGLCVLFYIITLLRIGGR